MLAAGIVRAQPDGTTLPPPESLQQPPIQPVPLIPGQPPPGNPIPGGNIPGAGPGTIPGTGPGSIPTLSPNPTSGGSPGAGTSPGGSGASAGPGPGPDASPGGVTPVSGGAVGGSSGGATFRVTQDRVLGPVGAMRERGRALFNSRTVGRANLACATCHRPDDLRAVARVYPRFNPFLRDVATLEQAQNACLTRFMRGSPLPYWSRNAVALSIYLVGE